MSDDHPPLIYMPTKGQQIFFSLIGIPMSALSITGSYFIIRHARQSKGTSPYRLIMVSSSICDIIWSSAWVLQPFMSDTSLEFQHPDQVWIWAFGNKGSCMFLGAMTQFGLSAHWFSGLISFYFLLTVRFGVRQATFTKILPFLIGFIILWSVGTAIAGSVMGHFHPLGSGPGCWVGGDGFCEGAECDETVLLGWIIGGIPTLLMLIVVIANNLILYCHVRRTVVDGQRRAMEAEKQLERYSNTTGPKPLSTRMARLSSESQELKHQGGTNDDSNMSLASSGGLSLASSISHTGQVEPVPGGSSGKSFLSRLSSKSQASNIKGKSRDSKSGVSEGSRNSAKRRESDSSVASSGEMSFASIISGAGDVEPGRSSEKPSSFLSRFHPSDASVFSTGASVTPYKSSVLRSSEKQWKRVQEVGKQSFLYVGAYLLSFGWTFVINYLDSQNLEFRDDAESTFLPLLVMQSLCVPTMGFFNCCVYFRPKILSVSKEFPNESRVWKIRRAIYGKSIKPTPASTRPKPSATPSIMLPETLRVNHHGADGAMSSLDGGDLDSGSMGSLSEVDFHSTDQFQCSVIIEGDLEESSRRFIAGEASSSRLSLTSSKLELNKSDREEIPSNRRSLNVNSFELMEESLRDDFQKSNLHESKLEMYESIHLGESIDEFEESTSDGAAFKSTLEITEEEEEGDT